MQFAAKLSPRGVISSGRGSSSAGLTVTAVKEGGQWALEAGALVLADGQSLFPPFPWSWFSCSHDHHTLTLCPKDLFACTHQLLL